jgi:hypothetical protein
MATTYTITTRVRLCDPKPKAGKVRAILKPGIHPALEVFLS